MLVPDSTDTVVAKRTEQAMNPNTASLPKAREASADWLNREDFLSLSRRQKEAGFPVDYDV